MDLDQRGHGRNYERFDIPFAPRRRYRRPIGGAGMERAGVTLLAKALKGQSKPRLDVHAETVTQRSGKVDDPITWLWSTGLAHEPLIAKWMYDEINARHAANPRPGRE